MTSTRATMLSIVLLVLEMPVGEGVSAASAEISQRLHTQGTQPPPGIVQARDYKITNFQYNDVNWESEKCAKILFVRREGWGAKDTKNVNYLNINGGVKLVFYHHTEGHECNSTDVCAKILRPIRQEYHQVTKREIRT
uniref:Putative secreted protein n=1 Tax=Ixodes ricinus TaxID=34613 RepID=V5GMC3_IXORI